jgi:hypothetical protein
MYSSAPRRTLANLPSLPPDRTGMIMPSSAASLFANKAAAAVFFQ